jgi:hypothetical protein
MAPAPIIDIHVHAVPADSQGPPPLAFPMPVREWPVHDPLSLGIVRILGIDQKRPLVDREPPQDRTRSMRTRRHTV